MRGKKIHAREKKTHKMTRNGLIEKNIRTGEQRRLSRRTSDFSLKQKNVLKKTEGMASISFSSTGKKQKKLKQIEYSDSKDKYENLCEETPLIEIESAQTFGISSQKANKSLLHSKANKQKRKGIVRKHMPIRKMYLKKAIVQASNDNCGKLSFQKRVEQEKIKEDTTPPETKQQKRKKQQKFQFDRQEQTLEERKSQNQFSQQNKAEKAKQQVEYKEKKLEMAHKKLPTQKRLRFHKQYNKETGKLDHKLYVQKEVKPENSKDPVKRTTKATIIVPLTALWNKGHQKIHQVEQDNVGVESTHKIEKRIEFLAVQSHHYLQRQRKYRPYRMIRKLERQTTRANINYLYQRTLLEHPELERKTLSKWIQKQRIKRQYLKAAKQTESTAHTIRTAKDIFVQIIRVIAHVCGMHKTVIGMVAICGLLFVMLSSVLGSCGAMFSGSGVSTFAASYTANDVDINNSDLYYSEKEVDLQYEINHIEETHTGFDEYRYNIEEIGHNSYELMAYLSAMYDFFTFSEVQTVLDTLFEKQYNLQLIEEVEIRTDSEDNQYEWHILNVILTVTPMENITVPEMIEVNKKYKYEVYQQTYGNRQNYGNPFSFSWLPYVTSPYGYRINPFTGKKDLHKGIDIAVATGTPILAIHDGYVISAGNAGDYGLCVVIEDKRGYQSRYAHCSELSVSAGQEVKKGDIVASVGSTGNSTGSHLHLEVTHHDEYLNPFYFVDNGDDGSGAVPGTPSGPIIPNDSGSPMGDGTFEAMLAEAEKYLGYPYVWGGSSPSTSFDCSGYVSWVINQSGVGDVGRQTAQGLYGLCTPVSYKNARPGDLIFFTKTYSSPSPVSHVGIYVGNGKMIHCGNVRPEGRK